MKRLSVLLIVVAFFALTAWSRQDCEAVNYDHPDCDKYPTTTTTVTYPSTTTTVTVPETTTTATTPNETTTTQPSIEVTTTTIPVEQCPPGTVHQPPLCVATTIPHFDTTTTAAVGIATPLQIEELPMTGSWTALLVVLFLVLGLAGLALITRNREAHE